MGTKKINMKNEILVNRYGSLYGLPKEHWSRIAIFTADFIQKWGMIAAIPDGEDSAGRQKLRIATPDELVNRAFEVSEIFHKNLLDKGYAEIVDDGRLTEFLFPKDEDSQ